MRMITSVLAGIMLVISIGCAGNHIVDSAAPDYATVLGLNDAQRIIQTLDEDIDRNEENETVVLYGSDQPWSYGIGVIYSDNSVKKYDAIDGFMVKAFAALDFGGTSLCICLITDLAAADHEHNYIYIIDFSGEQPHNIWDDAVSSPEALGLQYAFSDDYRLNFSFLGQEYALDVSHDDMQLVLYNSDGTLNSYGSALKNWRYAEGPYNRIVDIEELNDIAIISLKQDYFVNNPFGPLANHPLNTDTTWRYNAGSGGWALAALNN